MTDDELLSTLISEVSDGRDVDWDAVERGLTAEQRRLVQQVRILAEVGRVHGTLAPDRQASAGAEPDLGLDRFGDPPTWGSIRLLEIVGRGTYGIVYRGHDERLDREVAVKLLRPRGATAEDEAELIAEGRRLARVRHPGVITVHGADRFGDVAGIWMEFIHGQTLEGILAARGPFSAAEATVIGIEVCSALAAVHGAGLLHRDVKAQNVMRERGGRIVLMDLGAGQDARVAGAGSSPTLVGTPLYLAPELLRSGTPSPRSDVYSVGVLLYRLVSGAYPVAGTSLPAIRAAHASGTHQLLGDVRTNLPRPFTRVVERTLSSDPSERYETAGVLGAALAAAIDTTFDAGASESALAHVERAWRSWPSPRRWALAAVTLLVVAGAVTILQRSWGAESVIQRRLTRPRQLTTALGVERRAAWSPDGRTLAYQSDERGNDDIWVLQVAGGPPVNLTADHIGRDANPVWAPDGTRLAFESDRDGGGLFIVPASGGAPRHVSRINRDEAAHPQWSADGEFLAHVVYDHGSQPQFQITSLNTSETRYVPLPGGQARRRYDVRWSPDGRFVAYVAAGGRGSRSTQVVVLRMQDGRWFEIGDGRAANWSPSWSPDGRDLYYVSDRGGTRDLWLQRLDEDGAPRDLPTALTAGLDVQEATVSPDGTSVAYTRGRVVANVWRVPESLDRPATWADATAVTSDQAFIEFIDVSPDGRTLLLSSDRSGSHDLWRLMIGASDLQQLTSGPDDNWDPRLSPDGQRIAFYSNRRGGRDIWVMSGDSAVPEPVTTGQGADLGPSWSPDGTRLAFQSDRSGAADVWVVALATGETSNLSAHPASDLWPDWSPDGEWILFQSDRDDGGLYMVSVATAELRRVSGGPAGRAKWSRDQQDVFFIRSSQSGRGIWRVRVADGQTRSVTDFSDRRGSVGSFALATDGRFIYFTWEERLQDLWAMAIEGAAGR